MTERSGSDFFIWALFQQLVRRNFAIGLEEYGALLRALRMGFGWESRDELKKVICALWASSREEEAVVTALFDQYALDDWTLSTPTIQPAPGATTASNEAPVPVPAGDADTAGGQSPVEKLPSTSTAVSVAATSRLPPLKLEELPRLAYSHVFLPQYPVSYRRVAQTWRRLRWPLREGPAIELDVGATIARRSRLGIGTPPVLRPRRRNQASVLLLVDRLGSMAPFHGYVDEVSTAIAEAGRLGRVALYFFHDTPLEGTDLSILAPLEGQLFPQLDTLLGDIPALMRGVLFTDRSLLQPIEAEDALAHLDDNTAIVIISDGGAARSRFDMVRLVDTLASLKGLLQRSARLVWLNPLQPSAWGRGTARQIARHVPMFPMDRDGMHRAVNVLRGQPFALDQPLPRTSPPMDSPGMPRP
jgi:uncharacterized protein